MPHFSLTCDAVVVQVESEDSQKFAKPAQRATAKCHALFVPLGTAALAVVGRERERRERRERER